MKWLARVANTLLAIYQKFNQAYSPFLAAAIAYFIFFSVFPLLLGIVSLMGYVLPDYPMVSLRLTEIIPTQSKVVGEIIQGVIKARGSIGFFAIILLLWSGNGLFLSLGQALDMVWKIPPKQGIKPLLRHYAISLGMTLSIVPLVIAATVLFGLAYNLAIPGKDFILQGLPVISMTFCLIPIYRYLPSQKTSRPQALLAALIAGPLWEILRRAFGWYLERFAHLNLVYGPIAGIIGFLLWIYLSGMVFLLGATAARVLIRRH